MTPETPQPGNITGDRITPILTTFQVDVDQEVDMIVQDKLAKAGITEDVIAEYRKGVEPFQGIERIPDGDEQMLKRVTAMHRELVNKRNIIKKICEAARKPLNMERNAWLKFEKEYSGQFEAIEEPLARLKDAYKAEQERKEAEEKARQEAAKRQRYMEMEALGFTRRYRVDGTQVYFLGETEFEVEAIDAADHDTFSNIFASARMVSEEIAAAKAEQERKAKEERERIAAEQEALRKQQEEMARKEAEMKAREEAMQRQVNEVRKGELMALGCEVNGWRVFVAKDGEWIFSLHIPDLYKFTDAQWADEILAAKLAVEERNLWEAEAAEQLGLRVAQEPPKEEEQKWEAPWDESEIVTPENALLDPYKAAQIVAGDAEERLNKVCLFGEWTSVDGVDVPMATTLIVATASGNVTCAYSHRQGDNIYWNDELNRCEHTGNPMQIEGGITHFMPFPKHPNHGN